MHISEENIDVFEAYLSSSLSTKEMDSFEARLIYDTEFSEQFERYKEIELSVKKHYRDQVKLKFKEVDKKLDNAKNGKVRPLKWWFIASALAAAVFVGFIIFQNQKANISEFNTKDLVAKYWPHEEGLPVKMSNKGKYDDAMNAFKLKKWNEAEELLLEMDSDTASYFLGVIFSEKNETNAAEKYFMQVQKSSFYYDIAQFSLALTYIKNEKIDLAIKTLHSIIENKSPFEPQAKSILEQLK
jgi:TolA-binding protein